MEHKKSKKGGARPGAGRKKMYVKQYFFNATKEVYDILEHLDENRSQFINRCILAERNSHLSQSE